MAEVRNDYIGIVVAMPDEARIVKGLLSDWTSGTLGGKLSGLAYWMSQPVAVVVCGQGEDNARTACQALYRQYHPRFVLSVGYCGGLQLGVNAGDIVTSAKVIRESAVLTALESGDKELKSVQCWEPESGVWEIAKKANQDYRDLQERQGTLPSMMRSCWEDTTVTTNRVVAESRDKLALGKLSQAVAVDMESAIIAEMMSVAGIPWLVVRAVSDAASTDVPLDFQHFSDDNGYPKIGSIIKEVIRTPKMIPGLVRLGLNSQKANSSLSTYLQCLLGYVVGYGKPEKAR